MARALLVITIVTGCRDDAAIRKWLTDYEVARACMMSSPEYGTDGTTAAAAAALLQDTSCSDERLQLLLVRDADRSQFPDWRGLSDEIRELRATVGDGAVIDRLDARVAKMRERVGMSALRRTRVPLEQLPAGKPVRFAGSVLSRSASVQFTPGRILVTVSSDRSKRESPVSIGEITAIDDARVLAVLPPGYRLAHPSRRWAVKKERGVLSIVQLEDGRSTRLELPGDDDYDVSSAMDVGSSRAVILEVLSHDKGFVVAVSHDDGHRWSFHPSPSRLPLERSSQNEQTGEADIFVESEGYAYRYHFERLEPWRFPEPIEIPKRQYHIECRDGDVIWAMEPVNKRVLHRLTPTPRTFELDEVYPWGVTACVGDSALVLRRAVHEALDLCRGDSCRTVYTANHSLQGTAALDKDGRWIYAVTMHGVVAVWREGRSAPALYRLPAEELAGIATLRDGAYLVIIVDDVYQLVELPALEEIQAR